MAVEREDAVIREEIILRVGFTWHDEFGNEHAYDPVNFEDVEILDEQNVIVETIPSASIVRDDIGLCFHQRLLSSHEADHSEPGGVHLLEQ